MLVAPIHFRKPAILSSYFARPGRHHLAERSPSQNDKTVLDRTYIKFAAKVVV
jgi:hypothetical protein